MPRPIPNDSQADSTVLERTFPGVLPAKISDLLAKTYVITNPVTGEESFEPGCKLMAMIKAATDTVYLANLQPAAGVASQPKVEPNLAG